MVFAAPTSPPLLSSLRLQAFVRDSGAPQTSAALVDPLALGLGSAPAEAAAAAVSEASSLLPCSFQDHKRAFATVSTPRLLQSLCVYSLCRVRPLVANAEQLLAASERVLGAAATERLVRATFYAQFVGGDDVDAVRAAARPWTDAGVGVIVNYAAEGDAAECEGAGAIDGADALRAKPQAEAAAPAAQPASLDAVMIAAAEAAGVSRDALPSLSVPLEALAAEPAHSRAVHASSTRIYVQQILDARALGGPRSVSAIKLTALGAPGALETVSRALDSVGGVRGAWVGHPTLEAFLADARGWDTARIKAALVTLPPPETVMDVHDAATPLPRPVDLRAEVSRVLGLLSLPTRGALAAALEGDLLRFEAAQARLMFVAETAAALDGRILYDAEHSHLQKALDWSFALAAPVVNASKATLFNTHQCYLTDSHERLRGAVARARAGGYAFAGKLVRGAYVIQERRRAAAVGLASPVHATIDDTHRSYDAAVEIALDEVQRSVDARAGGDASAPLSELFVASHNQRSVERAVLAMARRGLTPAAPVTFAQLYGMADNLALVLAQGGYNALKLVPYGSPAETLPFLVRRAQENSDVLGGVAAMTGALKKELWRRTRAAVAGSA